MTYTINYTGGSTDSHDTYEGAVAAVESIYGEAEIGHDGDLSDGGERTLCWADAEDAENDDGARAVASITAR